MPAAQNPTTPNIDINSPYTPRYPKPVVSISLNNPIGTMLRKIKNFLIHKQTLFSTSFSIKVTPIVAIVSLAGVAALFGGGVTTAYNFGKTVEQKFISSTPSPTPKVIVQIPTFITLSKAGTIKATYQYGPTPTVIVNEMKQSLDPTGIATSTPQSGSPRNDGDQTSVTPTAVLSPTATLTPTPFPILRYILIDKNDAVTLLSAPTSVKLGNFVNLRVLITGSYNQTTNTLMISKPSDVEVLE